MDKNTDLMLSGGMSPAEMIQKVIEGKGSLENLEKLLELQFRWEANESKKAYVNAMTEFKANPPKIEKDKKVDFNSKAGGRVKYNHASLANVTDKISTCLSKYGLSASWSTESNGLVKVTCKITHVLGHSEETSLSAPPDDSGLKNPIQKIASTVSYLERYTLLAITGLATTEMDNDAQSASEEVIDDKQLSTIRDLMADLDIKESRITKYAGCETLEKMPKSKYKDVMADLEKKREDKKNDR